MNLKCSLLNALGPYYRAFYLYLEKSTADKRLWADKGLFGLQEMETEM